jgi:hypothetical protein
MERTVLCVSFATPPIFNFFGFFFSRSQYKIILLKYLNTRVLMVAANNLCNVGQLKK